MPGYDEPEHRAWWAAREQAYRERPEVQTAIRAHEAAWAAELDQDHAYETQMEEQAEQGVSGAREALDREMARKSGFSGTPRIPSARDEPGEWEAFFREFYGRDLPLNAAYQASLHRAGAHAPPGAGGPQAAPRETGYPGGYDDAELTAERLGITVEELLGSRDPGPSPGPAADDIPDAAGQAIHLDRVAYADEVRDFVARVRQDAPARGESRPDVYLYPNAAEAGLAAGRGSIPPGCVGYLPEDGRAWVQLPGGRQADGAGILAGPGLRHYAGAARVARALTARGPLPGAVLTGRPAATARIGEIAFPTPATVITGRPGPGPGSRPRGRPRLGWGMLRPDRRSRG